MRTVLRAALPLCLLAGLAGSASAQGAGGGSQISYEAVTSAPVGSWAEYQTTVKGQTGQMKMRYALVEKSDKKIAIEIDGNGPMGSVTARMEYEKSGPDTWKLTRLAMKPPTGEANEMPLPPEPPTLKKGQSLGEAMGSQKITVPGGTFECKQFKNNVPQLGVTMESWINDKVLPVGLVKQADTAGNIVTVLTGTGSGATGKFPAKKAAAAPAQPAAPAKAGTAK